MARELVSGRSIADLVYVALSVPFALFGLLYLLVSFAAGAVLAVSAVGIPLISWAVPGTRMFGRMRRGMALTLLDEAIPPPAPFRPPRGLLARVSAGLRDPVGWRAIAYLLVSLPVAFGGVFVAFVTWGYGLGSATHPIRWLMGQHGVEGPMWSSAALGVALVLLAPWAVRVFLLVDRLLMRALLGRAGSADRIRDLERSRAYAIDDVAATLRRIERDLHDGVQARLVALAMNLTMLNETLAPEVSDASRKLLTAALGHAKDGIAELRHMVVGIHPPALDAGLEIALGTLAARSPIPVDVRAELPERPTEAIETIAYFSIAELLTNVTKHSGAQRASVEITESDGRMLLRVSDDGVGGADIGGGTGLRGLTERVGTVDGRLGVHSPAGGPTVITVDLPLHA
jgi:signal transduction histidine kinase